ncbi:MAG: pentapeptide repeat-containing protein [Chitinophagales bacterium]|nr:pentapeptide repeat-containing protein [Chitinophagales bacterium]
MQGAILERAKLRGTRLRGSDLSGANLRQATLFGTYLMLVNMKRVNLDGANLIYVRFADLKNENPAYNLDKVINLHRAINLETANWRGTIFEGRDWAKWVAEEKKKEEDNLNKI